MSYAEEEKEKKLENRQSRGMADLTVNEISQCSDHFSDVHGSSIAGKCEQSVTGKERYYKIY